MVDSKYDKEWSSSEYLPRGFTEWLKETIREIEIQDKKVFRQIAFEFGVNPAILSRWIGGMGPMTHTNIRSLACILSPVVYTFLGFSRPITDDESLVENIIETDRVPPSPWAE